MALQPVTCTLVGGGGGQFERPIGLVKQAIYKTIAASTLNWAELSEVILDVETQINRRHLDYMEDDVELPTLTPSTYFRELTYWQN